MRARASATVCHSLSCLFKYSHLPYTTLEWNKSDMKIRTSESPLSFKNSLLEIGQSTAKPTYNIRNSIGLKFLKRLKVELNHLNKHKSKNNS